MTESASLFGKPDVGTDPDVCRGTAGKQLQLTSSLVGGVPGRDAAVLVVFILIYVPSRSAGRASLAGHQSQVVFGFLCILTYLKQFLLSVWRKCCS